MLFEHDLNKQLKTKQLRVNLIFIPVRRDELIPALLDGRGDIAASGITVTAARDKLIDFSMPVVRTRQRGHRQRTGVAGSCGSQ